MTRAGPWTILADGASVSEILWWVGGLALFIVAGALVLYWTKRLRARYQQQDVGADSRLAIEDIERMYSSGLISSEEFETLRRSAIGLGAARGEKGDSPLSSGGEVDDESTSQEDLNPPDAKDD